MAGTLLAVWAVGLVAGLPTARAENAGKAVTSRAARETSARSIPYDKLTESQRAKVAAVVRNAGLFRRLPAQVIDCDPHLYLFLLRNPDVVVDIWRVMDISELTMDRLDATHFRCTDGEGTSGTIELMHSTHDTQVIYSEGLYEGPLFPRSVRGQCLLVLRTGYTRETNGRDYITTQIDAFLHVENVGLEFLAKTFHPLVGRMADYNFSETATFVSSLSHTAEKNPAGVARLGQRLAKVDDTTREQFSIITRRIAEEAVVGDAGKRDELVDAPGGRSRSNIRSASTPK